MSSRGALRRSAASPSPSRWPLLVSLSRLGFKCAQAAPAAVYAAAHGYYNYEQDSMLSPWSAEDDGSGEKRGPAVGSSEFWWKLGLSAGLVLLGGVFAGLTLGLMGLDMINLKVLSTSGTELEQKQARKVLSLLERGRHWVLCVLLLSNVAVNESLPIFLDEVMGGGTAAVIVSTAAIVIFGEIVPQSLCARYGLAIGAKSAPMVLALMYLEYPIVRPISKLLDWVLGEEEGVTYRKAELKTFVGLHRTLGEDQLDEDEVTIISSVLELSEKSVESIMTPIQDVFTLTTTQTLDHETVDLISKEGYSRVPIYDAGSPEKVNFVGMLLVKQLLSYDPDDCKKVSDFPLSILPEGPPQMTCLQALNFFQEGRSHILLVSSHPGEDKGAMGVVSLEDVIEEIIGEEIIDETDVFVDVHKKLRVVRRQPTQPKRKSLAPILKDVIERRKASKGGGNALVGAPATLYGTEAYGNQQQPETDDQPVTNRQVKLKGGKVPQKKQTLVTRKPTYYTESEGDHTPHVEGYEESETQPLLKQIHNMSQSPRQATPPQ